MYILHMHNTIYICSMSTLHTNINQLPFFLKYIQTLDSRLHNPNLWTISSPKQHALTNTGQLPQFFNSRSCRSVPSTTRRIIYSAADSLRQDTISRESSTADNNFARVLPLRPILKMLSESSWCLISTSREGERQRRVTRETQVTRVPNSFIFLSRCK